MPTMDGIEATRRIKQATPSIVVIGLSVRNHREAEEAMRQAGASGYLTKESAAQQLHQAICELLQRATPLGVERQCSFSAGTTGGQSSLPL